MRFKKIFCIGFLGVIIGIASSLLAGGGAWAECAPTGDPLDINYSTLTMSCGGSQVLSAAG